MTLVSVVLTLPVLVVRSMAADPASCAAGGSCTTADDTSMLQSKFKYDDDNTNLGEKNYELQFEEFKEEKEDEAKVHQHEPHPSPSPSPQALGVTLANSVALKQTLEVAPPEPLMPNADHHFEKFLGKHARGYHDHSDAAEKEHRRAIFHQNLQKIDQRNADEYAKNPSADRVIHGITKHADWSEDEFRALLGYKKIDRPPKNLTAIEQTAQQSSGVDRAPCNKNWASRGEIRNQGSCGDCWAFSTVGQIRSAHIQQHGMDPGRLSTQFLVDCVRQTTCHGGVNGCCGGDPGEAMNWIESQGGIPTQAAYGDILASLAQLNSSGPVSPNPRGITLSGNNPETAYPCKANIPKAVTVTGKVHLKSETEMASHVCQTGSLSIILDASSWQTYKSGVIKAHSCGTSVDHAVQVIGLNTASNAWIVQNSWGPDWGVAVDGGLASEDEYSNCGDLAKHGCSDEIKDVCPVSCGTGNGKTGGYVYLAYGENTCAIATEPIAADTATVQAAAAAAAAKTTTTAAAAAMIDLDEAEGPLMATG